MTDTTRREDVGLADTEARIASAQFGDPEAIAWLYRLYVERVYRYQYARVGNQADAEDLTSQTFLTALESLPRYHHRGRFAAWLFTIAHNKAADLFRRRRPEADLDSLQAAFPDSDPSNRLIGAEQEVALQRLVKALAPGEQELLRLRYVADLTFEEIAAVLGKSEAAVKKTLYRLLARLQARMESDHE